MTTILLLVGPNKSGTLVLLRAEFTKRHEVPTAMPGELVRTEALGWVALGWS